MLERKREEIRTNLFAKKTCGNQFFGGKTQNFLKISSIPLIQQNSVALLCRSSVLKIVHAKLNFNYTCIRNSSSGHLVNSVKRSEYSKRVFGCLQRHYSRNTFNLPITWNFIFIKNNYFYMNATLARLFANRNHFWHYHCFSLDLLYFCWCYLTDLNQNHWNRFLCGITASVCHWQLVSHSCILEVFFDLRWHQRK